MAMRQHFPLKPKTYYGEKNDDDLVQDPLLEGVMANPKETKTKVLDKTATAATTMAAVQSREGNRWCVFSGCNSRNGSASREGGQRDSRDDSCSGGGGGVRGNYS